MLGKIPIFLYFSNVRFSFETVLAVAITIISLYSSSVTLHRIVFHEKRRVEMPYPSLSVCKVTMDNSKWFSFIPIG